MKIINSCPTPKEKFRRHTWETKNNKNVTCNAVNNTFLL
jgi:hypothetical protein